MELSAGLNIPDMLAGFRAWAHPGRKALLNLLQSCRGRHSATQLSKRSDIQFEAVSGGPPIYGWPDVGTPDLGSAGRAIRQAGL
jgi:hypothetical protein